MELYTLLRAFADSWFLLAMTTFYVGVFVWVVRPGSNRVHDEIKQIPLRDDRSPAPELTLGCTGGCADCPCAAKGARS
ncbi:MAG: cbb3-type cytochrome c oxidase subunit 3 [Pseudomonadota bacterium]